MDGERLFCDVGLARRIEHAEARFVAACSDAARARLGDDAGFTRPLADGVASFAEAGSPFTKVAGLGFAGLPDLTELEEWLAEVADASLVADTEGLPSHEDFPRELLVNALRNMAGVRRYLAVRDGEFAGGASFRVTDGIAQFTGAAVSRRRCCRPGSPRRPRPGATSPWSPRNRVRSPSRTCSGRGSTCSTRGRSW